MLSEEELHQLTRFAQVMFRLKQANAEKTGMMLDEHEVAALFRGIDLVRSRPEEIRDERS